MIVSKLTTISDNIKINTFSIQCFFVATATILMVILSLTRSSFESKIYSPDNPADYVAEEAITLVSFGLSIILVSKFLLKFGIYLYQKIYNKTNISISSGGRTLFCSGMLALALFLRGAILVAISDVTSRSRYAYYTHNKHTLLIQPIYYIYYTILYACI